MQAGYASAQRVVGRVARRALDLCAHTLPAHVGQNQWILLRVPLRRHAFMITRDDLLLYTHCEVLLQFLKAMLKNDCFPGHSMLSGHLPTHRDQAPTYRKEKEEEV